MTVLDHGQAVPASYGRGAGRRHNRDLTTLASSPRLVHLARDRVSGVLAVWGLGALAGDVALVVSELVTNAVEAAASPLHVCVAADARWLMVAVADASPRCPLRTGTAPDAESGRGLQVVEALSDRWGWHLVTWPGLIKAVWAEFWIGQEPQGANVRPTPVPSSRRED